MSLVGCDTLIATSSATADGSTIFAKNSDRHPEECQHLRLYAAQDWGPDAAVRCQYLSIPQPAHTLRVLGSQPFWLWGFDLMTFLRDHGADPDPGGPATWGPTLCMHPGIGQTAASMVVHLRRQGFTAWCSLVTPCVSVFLPFCIDAAVPAALARGAATFSADSPWWRIKRLLDFAAADWGRWFPRIRALWDAWEHPLLLEEVAYQSAGCEERNAWVDANVSKLLREVHELERELGVGSSVAPAVPVGQAF